MKIRLDRTMYAKAQRIADAHNETFASFASRAVRSYAFPGETKTPRICKLTRKNSISAAIHSHPHPYDDVTPERIRQCIALAIEEQDKQDIGWPWRYDRSTLDAAIQISALLERRVIGYEEAQAFCDRRVAQRKEELRVAEKAKRKK
jgi:hypothetical protein